MQPPSSNPQLTMAREAEDPFSASALPNPDAILRTSDHVDFYVHKAIIGMASDFFSHLFTDGIPEIVKDGLSVAVIEETSTVLCLLLQFCYPFMKPELHSFEQVKNTALVANKYCMPQVENRLQEQFVASTMFDKLPLASYAIAIQVRWPAVARMAAVHSLGHRFNHLARRDQTIEEIRNITGKDLHSLQEYHATCSKAARHFVREDVAPLIGATPMPWLRWYSSLPRHLFKVNPTSHDDCGCDDEWVYISVQRPFGTTNSTATLVHSAFVDFLTCIQPKIAAKPALNIREECTNEIQEFVNAMYDCRACGKTILADIDVLVKHMQAQIGMTLGLVKLNLEIAESG